MSTWFQQHRVEWIAETALIFGFIKREHIQKKFGVSKPQASLDINLAIQTYPGLLTYNASTKRYQVEADRTAAPEWSPPSVERIRAAMDGDQEPMPATGQPSVGMGSPALLTAELEQLRTERDALRTAIAASPRLAPIIERAEKAEAEVVQLRKERDPWAARIGEVLDDGDGFWRSCSGCHELNEGVPTGAYSAAFRTHVGLGCRECGGLGVVWDETDYAAMGDFLSQEPAPSSAVLAARAPLLRSGAVNVLVEKAFSDPVEFRPTGWREQEPALRFPTAAEAKARILSALEQPAPAFERNATNDLIAAVLLQHGNEDQRREALAYVGIVQQAAPEGQQESVVAEWQRRTPDFGWQRVNPEDLEHYRSKGAELRALYTRPAEQAVPDALPQDVIDLVIAARIVAFEDQSPEALRALDTASEAFASRVPWDDDPETLKSAMEAGR